MKRAGSADTHPAPARTGAPPLARGSAMAALGLLASACVPLQPPLALTAERPAYSAALTASYVESSTPFVAIGSLETGEVAQDVPGRAALDIRRTLSAMPGEDGFLIDGESIGASPRPWLEFCRNDPSRTQCASEPVQVEMTEARLHQLMSAQAMVHQSTNQQPDEAFLGDRWELIEHNKQGDCEDMALTKRDILMTWGWPAGSLRPAICTIDRTGGTDSQLHAVLTVDTDAGTYVLGNLVDGVRSIDTSECVDWVMRADGVNWSWIEGGSTIPLLPVAANRQ